MKQRIIKKNAYLFAVIIIIAVLTIAIISSFEILHGYNNLNGYDGHNREECAICEIIGVLSKEIRTSLVVLSFLNFVTLAQLSFRSNLLKQISILFSKPLVHQKVQMNN